MTDKHQDAPHPLRSTLALLEREAARRAKGTHPGMMRLDDAELAALLEVLQREVGAAMVETEGAAGR
ncbi:hypothetical protein [Lichenibacterium dinghuense]|uniref:hypothetical protein n=1 Tax=Lichenibacterium dinghuense TaxID=2895977 RepID=UPI001F381F7E|nr:hypothetical protein [Lichenibacterium sp. 6Y81]